MALISCICHISYNAEKQHNYESKSHTTQKLHTLACGYRPLPEDAHEAELGAAADLALAWVEASLCHTHILLRVLHPHHAVAIGVIFQCESARSCHRTCGTISFISGHWKCVCNGRDEVKHTHKWAKTALKQLLNSKWLQLLLFRSVHLGYELYVAVRSLLSSRKTDSGLTQPVFICVGILEASVVVMFDTCSIMMCGKGFFFFC